MWVSVRVSDIDPGLPYAVFLQNTLFLWDAVPRVGTLGWYALPRLGKWNDDVSDPMSMPRMGIVPRRVSAAPLEPLEHRVSNLMPPWGKWNDDVSIRRVISSSWVR
jgi:hypothetical protein